MIKPYIEQRYYVSPNNAMVAKDVTSDRSEMGKPVSQAKLANIGGCNRYAAIRYPPSALTIGIPQVHRHPTARYYQLAGKSCVHKSPLTTLHAAYLHLNRYVREA